jgi:hypothetical protein
VNSCTSNPTFATPFSTPIVAGIPPLARTTDSKSEASATFSGKGNPDKLSDRLRVSNDILRITMCIYGCFKGNYRHPGVDGILNLFGDFEERIVRGDESTILVNRHLLRPSLISWQQ